MRSIKKVIALAAVLAVILAVIPFSGITAFAETGGGSIEVITCNDERLINVDENNNGNVMYFFTPEKDGTYAFYSYQSNFQVTGSLIDLDTMKHVSNNNGGRNGNFYIQHEMKAGIQYILQAKPQYYPNYGSYKVKVKELTEATGFSVDCGDSIIGYIGNETELYAEFAPENAIIESIEWDSNNKNVVTAERFDDKTLNSHALVKFVSPGTATLTATTESGKTYSVFITVKPAESISCDEEKYLSTEEGTSTALYSFEPKEDGIYLFYSYNNFFYNGFSYDNRLPVRGTIFNADMECLAEDSWGKDTNFYVQYDMKAGETYYLKAEPCFSDNSGSYYVKVVKTVPAQSLTLTAENLTEGYPGSNCNIYAEFAPINAAFEDITWTSSNPGVAEINGYDNSNCTLYFLSAGTAVITATAKNGLSDSITVTVNDIPEVTEDTVNTVEITEPNQEKRFKFIPSESGNYTFTINYSDWVNFEIRDKDNEFLCSNGRTFNYYLTEGETYYLYARLNGAETGTYTFTVSKAPEITDFEIIAYPKRMDYYEGGEEFEYSGLKLSATLACKGSITTQEWDYDNDDLLAGYTVEINDNYSEDDGKYVDTTVSCGGITKSFQFNILPNPVDHIELVQGTAVKYIENYNGYFNEFYNELTGNTESCFYYNTTYPNDAVIRIVYKSGDETEANVGDYIAADGYSVTWNNNQNQHPWTLGTDNASEISYIGHTVNLPITVEKNPVESIEVSGELTLIENAYGHFEQRYDSESNSNIEFFYYNYDNFLNDIKIKINYLDKDTPSKTANIYDKIDGYQIYTHENQRNEPWTKGGDNYLTVSYLGVTAQIPVNIIDSPVERIEIDTSPTREYIYGDNEFGYTDDNGNYHFTPEDIRGLSFTVYYTDGTSATFTYEDMDYDRRINGYECELLYDSDNPAETGDFPVTLTYMGKSAGYTVKLNASPVKSIELTKKPNKTEYTDYYLPDFLGAEFTITYADDTTHVVTLTEENLRYDIQWGCLLYKVDIDGYSLIIEPYYGEDEIHFVASYLGQSCEIRDITFTKEKEISGISLDNVSSDGNGMTVNITYSDNTTQTLTMNVLGWHSWNSYVDGFAMTENGILWYFIETHFDSNGILSGYTVDILGKNINVEAQARSIGDINGDGSIDIRDLVRLKKILASLTEDGAEASDLNADGDIGTADLVILRRYLLGTISLTDIMGDINGDFLVNDEDFAVLESYLNDKSVIISNMSDLNGDNVVDSADLEILQELIESSRQEIESSDEQSTGA